MNNSRNSVFMHAGSENRPHFVSGDVSYVDFLAVFGQLCVKEITGSNDNAVNEQLKNCGFAEKLSSAFYLLTDIVVK